MGQPIGVLFFWKEHLLFPAFLYYVQFFVKGWCHPVSHAHEYHPCSAHTRAVKWTQLLVLLGDRLEASSLFLWLLQSFHHHHHIFTILSDLQIYQHFVDVFMGTDTSYSVFDEFHFSLVFSKHYKEEFQRGKDLTYLWIQGQMVLNCCQGLCCLGNQWLKWGLWSLLDY